MDQANRIGKIGDAYLRNQRFATWVNHIIVLLMMWCVGVSIIQFGQRLFLAWEGAYLWLVTGGVTLEAILAWRIIKAQRLKGTELVVFRGAEWVVLIIVVRFFSYAISGFDRFVQDITTFGFDFYRYFLDPQFLFNLGYSLCIWFVSNGFAKDLSLQETDLTITDKELLRMVLEDREWSRRRMINRVFLLGSFMVVLSTMVRADLGQLWGDRPSIEGGGVNLLIYFVLGLVLFTISHFSTLRALWFFEQVPISKELAGRWIQYSFIFLFGVVLLSGLLPTGYTLGFLELLSYGVYFLLLVGQFIWFLVLYLLYLVTSLFGFQESAEPIPPEMALPQIPTPTTVSPESPSPLLVWLETLRTILFWVVFLIVVYLSFNYFFRQQQNLLTGVRWKKVFGLLESFLQWIRTLFVGVRREIAHAVQGSMMRLKAVGSDDERKKTLRFFNPRALSPRLQVIFYYLALIRKGEALGVQRVKSQTPLEYESRLRSQFPDLEGDLDQMTTAFVEAKYSQHEVTPAQASAIRSIWLRVRRAFRRSP